MMRVNTERLSRTLELESRRPVHAAQAGDCNFEAGNVAPRSRADFVSGNCVFQFVVGNSNRAHNVSTRLLLAVAVSFCACAAREPTPARSPEPPTPVVVPRVVITKDSETDVT